MKKRSIVGALLACLIFSPLHAETRAAETAHPKTFVAVLWPMFGPMAAPGLVELVAEIRMMPNVQVETYVHQAWPSLVDDLNNLPPGRRSIVIGYSLGANSTAEVANRVHHVDEFIALQPSMLSWNPDVKGGTYDRFVEIYNPNTWETWGGMGSKKLVGPNIEYIANRDSHPGAQFSGQFRNLVKTEIAKLSVAEPVEVAQARPTPPPAETSDNKMTDVNRIAKAELPQSDLKVSRPDPNVARVDGARSVNMARSDATPSSKVAQAGPAPSSQRLPASKPATAAAAPDDRVDKMALLEILSGAVDSGDLSAERHLTAAGMMDYAKRTYHVHPGATASCLPACGRSFTQ